MAIEPRAGISTAACWPCSRIRPGDLGWLTVLPLDATSHEIPTYYGRLGVRGDGAAVAAEGLVDVLKRDDNSALPVLEEKQITFSGHRRVRPLCRDVARTHAVHVAQGLGLTLAPHVANGRDLLGSEVGWRSESSIRRHGDRGWPLLLWHEASHEPLVERAVVKPLRATRQLLRVPTCPSRVDRQLHKEGLTTGEIPASRHAIADELEVLGLLQVLRPRCQSRMKSWPRIAPNLEEELALELEVPS
mmetsp:Transcript_57244/g.123863  ORF Transcript_57244/g.123863 Transcript_57244/m.123863 type:complete len:246 (-) Transcript_57244:1248-1985(-)